MTLRPGPRLVRALFGLALLALLVPVLPPVKWALAAGFAGVLGLAGREAFALRRLRILSDRPAEVVLSLDEEEPLALRLSIISSGAARPVRLTVRQVWPDLLTPPSTHLAGICRPGEVLTLEARVRAVARGAAPLAPPAIAATLSGWAERIGTAEPAGDDEAKAPGEETHLTVLPNLKAVRRLRGRLDRLFLHGLGTRAAPTLGKGRDFDRLREYVPGDDLRDVEWKATARHRKLITREYRLDRSQDVLLCLDRGHRMAARVAHVTRLDHAVNAAVLLASVCNRMEDRFGVLAFDNDVEQGLGQGRGSGHLRKLTAYAAGVMPQDLHTDYLNLGAHLRRRLRSRALVLLITALPELDEGGTLVRAVDTLIPQHLPVVIVFSDPGLAAAAAFQPADKPELCRTLVARDLWIERRRTLAELRRRGALVVETAPGDAGIEAVNSYLDVKRRQLL
ncbi:MAG TPA: DUF58 domain-containing protein [Thermoanaerobaculia bacterium]|jgi:uncharacterized protein (DUF58 family)|nr:DUF58 domain-containing protein [Thermoanaerobaculia bacterium]